jgi:hypothetical protein
MTVAASVAVEQCAKLRSDQKARLAAAQKTDAECRAACQENADMVDRLIRLSLAARLAEQCYMHSKDPAALEENRAAMKEIYDLCPKLKERFQKDADKSQTDELVQAGQAYQKAFEHWAFIQADIEKAQAVIAAAAQKGEDACDALTESCKKNVADMLAKGLDKLDSKVFAKKLAVADDASRLAMLVNESRVGEMRYLLTTDNKHLMAQQERFEKASALARDLKSRMKDKTDRAQMDTVAAAMQSYDDAMIKYVTGFKSQRDDAKTMAAKAAAFVAQCETIRNGQREKLRKAVELAQKLLAEHVGAAEAADTLVRLLMEARADEKNYFLRRDPQHLTAHSDRLGALLAAAGKLKDSFKEKENIDMAAAVITAIHGYRTAFRNYVDLLVRQDDSQQRMAAASKALQEQAGELEADQTSAMFRARDGASFWMIVCSLAGICLGTVLAVATTRQ